MRIIHYNDDAYATDLSVSDVAVAIANELAIAANALQSLSDSIAAAALHSTDHPALSKKADVAMDDASHNSVVDVSPLINHTLSTLDAMMDDHDSISIPLSMLVPSVPDFLSALGDAYRDGKADVDTVVRLTTYLLKGDDHRA